MYGHWKANKCEVVQNAFDVPHNKLAAPYVTHLKEQIFGSLVVEQVLICMLEAGVRMI